MDVTVAYYQLARLHIIFGLLINDFSISSYLHIRGGWSYPADHRTLMISKLILINLLPPLSLPPASVVDFHCSSSELVPFLRLNEILTALP